MDRDTDGDTDSDMNRDMDRDTKMDRGTKTGTTTADEMTLLEELENIELISDYLPSRWHNLSNEAT
jgi:hypothetical protein